MHTSICAPRNTAEELKRHCVLNTDYDKWSKPRYFAFLMRSEFFATTLYQFALCMRGVSKTFYLML